MHPTESEPRYVEFVPGRSTTLKDPQLNQLLDGLSVLVKIGDEAPSGARFQCRSGTWGVITAEHPWRPVGDQVKILDHDFRELTDLLAQELSKVRAQLASIHDADPLIDVMDKSFLQARLVRNCYGRGSPVMGVEPISFSHADRQHVREVLAQLGGRIVEYTGEIPPVPDDCPPQFKSTIAWMLASQADLKGYSVYLSLTRAPDVFSHLDCFLQGILPGSKKSRLDSVPWHNPQTRPDGAKLFPTGLGIEYNEKRDHYGLSIDFAEQK